PKMLSLLGERDADAFVPGINDLLDGGYTLKDGTTALSAEEKIARGQQAITAFAQYRQAKAAGNDKEAQIARQSLEENMPFFGYGYIKDANELVPNVPLTFYMFRVMVILGGYFILFFLVVLFLAYKRDLSQMRWMHLVALWTIPLAYLAGQAGWAVAECGRQPWAIQDMLPVSAAISKLDTGSVQLTFFLFLILFTILLIAEIGIMLKAIRKGVER
ncbi:MAG TPA: cytochrome ubiquinol oxidase subunit I, partial [Candidatus Bacteroides pullicola]|nr:cytochrome ubiquinol oxidase subunit I [Candidatus Bacteroides pullicola]